MNNTNMMRLSAYAILLSSLSSVAVAQATEMQGGDKAVPLDPIYVDQDGTVVGASKIVLGDEPMMSTPPADGGEFLRQVPGVASGRMGGHGLEIVIRGQSQNQLNIVDSGSFTFGGCPNRMDPPAATAGISRADKIVVERGYQSVTNGPGGSGGSVILEREAPEFEEDKRLSFGLSAGVSSNSGKINVNGDFELDLGKGFYVEGYAGSKTADNYEDGDGTPVRSSYDQKSAGLTFGYERNGVDLAFDIERDKVKDALFPGAGMDSPLSDTTIYRLRGGVDLDAGILRRIEGNLFLSEVDHVMDNFTLRPAGAMFARTPTTSDTHGGKIEAHLAFGATEAKVGLDLVSNNRMATFYAGGAAVPVLAENPAFARFLMWPDVTISQTGLYGETVTTLSDRTTLTLGARYDYVRATAGAAGTVPGGSAASPNTFYTAQYGTTFDAAREEHNFGGLARIDYALDSESNVFIGLSRSVRTADATERAMARSNWVGNPDIAPEKHHQLDLGYERAGANYTFNASVYADRVNDYILRDQFTVPGVTTYRNVDAVLTGIELNGSWQRGGFELLADATYTRGKNRTDGRDLAQIPPLSGSITASYGQDAWRAGGRVNWATAQDKIDPARDPGATPGWATLDLFGSYALNANTTLVAGVDNVFDKTYANHLSRTNVFDPTMFQVNEPGRTLYISLETRF
ncbi:TonB-dependent receptor domain-containing protein [Shimia sp. FJ5]|uniref:TonB-dependent receptor domain-containing protein n=1 Tax=Shimia sp. FJ5 TaxID=3079054 RepID=UPI00260AD308|nr:TonB-dependent receptor [Shimia sp. FJ5]MDV4143541.1 TonB-dependent receptor [Shimia sp. FJ5]